MTINKYFFAMSIIVILLSWIQELYVDIIHLQIMASIGFIISSSLHLTISIIMYNINHRMSKKIPDENDIIKNLSEWRNWNIFYLIFYVIINYLEMNTNATQIIKITNILHHIVILGGFGEIVFISFWILKLKIYYASHQGIVF